MDNVDGLYRFNRLRTKAAIIAYSIYLSPVNREKIEFQVTDVFFSLLYC